MLYGTDPLQRPPTPMGLTGTRQIPELAETRRRGSGTRRQDERLQESLRGDGETVGPTETKRRGSGTHRDETYYSFHIDETEKLYIEDAMGQICSNCHAVWDYAMTLVEVLNVKRVIVCVRPVYPCDLWGGVDDSIPDTCLRHCGLAESLRKTVLP